MEDKALLQKLAASLQDMIVQARNEKKWLYCSYQDLWFTPDELEKENKAGRFRWGVINWRLRDPQERLNQAIACTASAKAEEERIALLIGQSK